jgi:hypothetical protein
MKNVHLLPTDKPSRLIVHSTLLNEFRLLDKPYDDWLHKRHIYITSDEEIKEGDWVIYKTGEIVQYLVKLNTDNLKKIILTTDQDLIDDGVQAIDDTFLEWFVKNPSCEYVEFQRWYDGYKFGYKIIIPKEEPKQETERGLIIKKSDGSIFKQETLEEAKQRILDSNYLSLNDADIFEMGAKWQAERMYSEEDLKRAFNVGRLYKAREGDTNFEQWLSKFKKNTND